MFPIINLKETGINLRRIMDKRGISAKDVQEYLNLASVQSVYNWCNGINMPICCAKKRMMCMVEDFQCMFAV